VGFELITTVYQYMIVPVSPGRYYYKAAITPIPLHRTACSVNAP